jgi:hypothetical protein
MKFGPVWKVCAAVLWSFTSVVASCVCGPPSCHCHLDVVMRQGLLGIVSFYALCYGTALFTFVACGGVY